MLVLRYSMIYLNPASVPLHIPLGILPTPLEATLTKNRGGTPSLHFSSPTLSPIRSQNRRDRLQQNREVHPQAPILDVVQIQHHRGVERGIAPRLDLPQARYARLHIQPSKVLERVALVIVYRMWPRPY